MARDERFLYGLLLLVLAGCIATGFAMQGFSATLRGLWELQLRPGRLLIDFTAAAGEGAALVNAALAAAIGLALVPLSRVRLSGPTVAGVLTILGFGLFGKTPMNILPIIFGVFVSARLARRRFNEYLLMAMFGTALGPLVTMLAVETIASPALGLLIGIAGGVAAGMLLPPLALVMLRLHQGFSLYNIGLTAGFLGLLVAAVVSGARGALEMQELWNANPSPVLRLMIPVLCGMCIAGGTALAPRAAWAGQLKIMKLSGRLPTDFMSMVGVPAGACEHGAAGHGGLVVRAAGQGALQRSCAGRHTDSDGIRGVRQASPQHLAHPRGRCRGDAALREGTSLPRGPCSRPCSARHWRPSRASSARWPGLSRGSSISPWWSAPGPGTWE